VEAKKWKKPSIQKLNKNKGLFFRFCLFIQTNRINTFNYFLDKRQKFYKLLVQRFFIDLKNTLQNVFTTKFLVILFL
jgi:hypothetical protein